MDDFVLLPTCEIRIFDHKGDFLQETFYKRLFTNKRNF